MNIFKVIGATFLSLSVLSKASYGQKLRVALAPYRVQANLNVGRFCEKVSNLTMKAAKGGASVVVLPELVGMDVWRWGEKDEKKELQRVADLFPSLQACLVDAAKKNKVEIIGASTFRRIDNEVFNSAFAIEQSGSVSFQDKLTLTPWEVSFGISQGRTLNIFERPWGRFVVTICLDVESPHISQYLANKSFDVILVPSMTESKAGLARVRWTAKARAIEHYAFVGVVGTIGKVDKSWINFGTPSFASPEGKSWPATGFLADGVEGQQDILFADLDILRSRELREKADILPAVRGVPLFLKR